MAANGSALTGFFNPYTNQEQMFYIGSDQQVYQIYYTPGPNVWSSQNMTAASSAPVLAASGSALTGFFNSFTNQQQLFYIGADQQVYQIYYTPGPNTWSSQNMTTAAAAPTGVDPGSGLTSFFNSSTNQQQLFYVGSDKTVYQIYYTPGPNTWSSQNMTAATGNAPPADSGDDPTSFFNPSTDQEQAFYIDTDQRVYQIYYTPGPNTWASQDMTAASNAPTLAVHDSGLTSFYNASTHQQQLFYIGTDQRIYQIYYTPGPNVWSNQDMIAAANAPVLAQIYYTLSGQVQAGGTGFTGVTLTLNGTTQAGTSVSQSAVADANGNYLFHAPAGGNYTVTPSAGDYTFDAPSASFSNLSGNQTANFTGYINGASTNPSTPDTGPAPYPNYLSSAPPPGWGPANGSDISGLWTDSASNTWNLQSGSGLVGGSYSSTNPACETTITWVVSGSGSGGQYNLSASNPSPPTACNEFNPTLTLAWTSTSDVTATANVTLTAPSGYYFASTGTNTEPGGTLTLTRPSAPTYTLTSGAQVAIPGATNNAQIVPLSTGDTVPVTTTASNSNFPVGVSYSSRVSNPNNSSNCVASLSVGDGNGTGSATSNMTASPSGCGGIFSAVGAVGGTTTNALTVVVPPQAIIQMLLTEAGGQPPAGDNVTEMAIGAVLRNRLGNNAWFRSSGTTYQQAISVGRFDGYNQCQAARNCIQTGHDPETKVAALIYAGVSTPDTDVGGSGCYFSPDYDDWINLIKPALVSGTTALPSGIHSVPSCYFGNKQLVYKSSVGNNANHDQRAGAPAIILVRWRRTTDPAVVQIP